MTLRYFDGCPHWRTAFERLNAVLGEMGEDEITVALERVETPDDAQRFRFRGSPTILLDGRDPFETDIAADYGLSCRVYRTPDGPAGSPTLDQLRGVLA